MPNRIIKETICTSEEIDALTDAQEVMFYRLMVNCDDFGLFDGRLKIIASKCYPLKSIDINCIQEMLSALVRVDLISLYEFDGKPYLSITNWSKHQQIRAQRAKFPTPEQGVEITCNQLISDAPVIQSNPIQSESLTQDKPARVKKPATSLPDDFEPNEACRSLAANLGVSVEGELPKFRDHHLQKGTLGKDWNAGFRTWLNNAVKFGTAEKTKQAAYELPDFMRGAI